MTRPAPSRGIVVTSRLLARAVAAEFAKLASLRSIRTAVCSFVVISIGIGLLEGWQVERAIETHNPALIPDFSPSQAGLDGLGFGLLAIIVLGVLVVTVEYGSGMVGLSLLAQPTRWVLLAAKAAVVVATSAVLVPFTAAATYLSTEWALGPYGVAITAPGVAGAMAGAVVYLTFMGLFAMGTAVMTRSPVAPLVVLLPLVLTGSQILSVIGATADVARYLPDQAGASLMTIRPDPSKLGRGSGLAVLVGWAAAALGGGLILLRRRDV